MAISKNQVYFVQHMFWLAKADRNILDPSHVVNKITINNLIIWLFSSDDFLSSPFIFRGSLKTFVHTVHLLQKQTDLGSLPVADVLYRWVVTLDPYPPTRETLCIRSLLISTLLNFYQLMIHVFKCIIILEFILSIFSHLCFFERIPRACYFSPFIFVGF